MTIFASLDWRRGIRSCLLRAIVLAVALVAIVLARTGKAPVKPRTTGTCRCHGDGQDLLLHGTYRRRQVDYSPEDTPRIIARKIRGTVTAARSHQC